MIKEPDNSTIDALVRILRKSRSILFITGAGVSAESGIPTYRGIGGLYNVDTTEDGVAIEEALSASMLADNPALTWKYLAQIGMAVQGARHNRAHEVIAEMESRFHRVWTLTQNVDGFHRAAGSKNLIEAHGNMHSLSCTKCKYMESLDEFDAIAIPPKCPHCGALVRPDVVLFGELIELITHLYPGIPLRSSYTMFQSRSISPRSITSIGLRPSNASLGSWNQLPSEFISITSSSASSSR